MALKKTIVALLSASAVLAAMPARAADPVRGLETFHADGVGTLSGQDDTVSETATLTGRFIGHRATMTFQLTNGFRGDNGTLALCAYKSGTATITTHNTSTITMSLAGVGCNAPDGVNATGVTYVITGGTKDFAGAKGTGRISWGEEVTSHEMVLRLDGNIYRPYRPRDDD